LNPSESIGRVGGRIFLFIAKMKILKTHFGRSEKGLPSTWHKLSYLGNRNLFYILTFILMRLGILGLQYFLSSSTTGECNKIAIYNLHICNR
jgi:non-ribosomal peptide synthetase component E (peptide arylation enzyme)